MYQRKGKEEKKRKNKNDNKRIIEEKEEKRNDQGEWKGKEFHFDNTSLYFSI